MTDSEIELYCTNINGGDVQITVTFFKHVCIFLQVRPCQIGFLLSVRVRMVLESLIQ